VVTSTGSGQPVVGKNDEIRIRHISQDNEIFVSQSFGL
jgi:hypothetical protein